jgi:hypothetical protein
MPAVAKEGDTTTSWELGVTALLARDPFFGERTIDIGEKAGIIEGS